MNPLTKSYLETTKASFSLSIPSGGKALVKKESQVTSDQIIAKGEKITLKEFNLAKALGISGKKIVSLLVKSLGSKVEKGELIAKQEGVFSKKQFLSPTDGTLESLSEEGVLRIKVAEKKYEVKTPLAGQITSVNKNKIEISFPALKVIGVWGVGGQRCGRLMVLGSQEKGATVFDLKGSFEGAIVAFSGPLTIGLWHKAVSINVAGLVCGKLPDEEFSRKIEKEVLRVLGQEKRIAPPLLVVGEEKEGKIKEEIWKPLVDSKEKMVVIKGEEKCLLIPR